MLDYISQEFLTLDAEFVNFSSLLLCNEEDAFMRGDACGMVHTTSRVFRDYPALVGIDAIYRALQVLLLAADEDSVDMFVIV